MKYYVYISDAKVDMLLPQVPHETKKKIASEFGFDFKILKGSRKTETESEESRINRLETVLAFLREYGKVGTVEEPTDFIDDTQDMWFGPAEKDAMAYFSGWSGRTLFALAGSARHLVGANPKECEWPVYSALNCIAALLIQKTESRPGVCLNGVCELAHEAMANAYPQQRLEFFAKRLLFDRYHKFRSREIRPVLLATPLYVAMTD